MIIREFELSVTLFTNSPVSALLENLNFLIEHLPDFGFEFLHPAFISPGVSHWVLRISLIRFIQLNFEINNNVGKQFYLFQVLFIEPLLIFLLLSSVGSDVCFSLFALDKSGWVDDNWLVLFQVFQASRVLRAPFSYRSDIELVFPFPTIKPTEIVFHSVFVQFCTIFFIPFFLKQGFFVPSLIWLKAPC